MLMFPNGNFKYQISSYSLLYENMVIVAIAQKVIDILCTILFTIASLYHILFGSGSRIWFGTF